jgi:hypothetical protein
LSSIFSNSFSISCRNYPEFNAHRLPAAHPMVWMGNTQVHAASPIDHFGAFRQAVFGHGMAACAAVLKPPLGRATAMKN